MFGQVGLGCLAAACGPADTIGTFAYSCNQTANHICIDLGDGNNIATPISANASSTPCTTMSRVGHCIVVNSNQTPPSHERINYYPNSVLLSGSPQTECSESSLGGYPSYFSN